MTFTTFMNEIARRTNLPLKTIRLVIDTMADVLIEESARGGNTLVKGLGNFRMYKFKGSPRLAMKSLKTVKERMKEQVTKMEKYGVQTDKDNTKTASDKKTCPLCTAPLEEGSSVPKCPIHGTGPFERPGHAPDDVPHNED